MLVSLLSWVLFTIALTVWFSVSSGSQTYGPLLSVIALLLWAGATSLALHLGMALSAELASQRPSLKATAGDDARDASGRHARVSAGSLTDQD